MKHGDILLVPFPFSELKKAKVRPAVVLAITEDNFHDLVIAAISSVIPETLSNNELKLSPSDTNGLRTQSVVKVDRLVTLKRNRIIAELGQLETDKWQKLVNKFKNLVDV